MILLTGDTLLDMTGWVPTSGGGVTDGVHIYYERNADYEAAVKAALSPSAAALWGAR